MIELKRISDNPYKDKVDQGCYEFQVFERGKQAQLEADQEVVDMIEGYVEQAKQALTREIFDYLHREYGLELDDADKQKWGVE